MGFCFSIGRCQVSLAKDQEEITLGIADSLGIPYGNVLEKQKCTFNSDREHWRDGGRNQSDASASTGRTEIVGEHQKLEGSLSPKEDILVL